MLIFGFPAGEMAVLAVAVIGAGVVTGILAGLLGIGGAAITVPVLYEVFRYLEVPDEVRMQLCVGTSLAVIVPVSLRSYFAHRAKAAVLDDVLRLWIVPVVLGVVGGAGIAFVAPSALFKIVFVVVGALIGTKLVLGRADWRLGDVLPAKPVTRAIGFVIGLLSSLMGIAGGSLSTLFLTLYGKSIHVAVATSSGLGIWIALPGMIGYMIAGWPQMHLLPPLSIGYVSLIGLVLFAPASVLAAPFGARLAHNTSRRKLEIAFAMFLFAASLRFLISLFE
jgi:uncharacterized membrane protein YfcA